MTIERKDMAFLPFYRHCSSFSKHSVMFGEKCATPRRKHLSLPLENVVGTKQLRHLNATING